MSSVGTLSSATAVGFCFPILGGIAVALRFYSRLQHKASLQLDDWITVPAWLCVTGCCASLLAGVFRGVFVGVAITAPDDTTEQERVLAEITAALVILWMASNFLIKSAVLLFYRRIFVGKVFKICNWTLIGLSIVWFVYAILSWFLYCGTDLHADFEGGWATCAPWGFKIQLGVFVLDSTIDFFILLLPIPLVWKLRLDLQKRIALVVIFCLGAFAFVAGLCNTIIQLVYLTNPSLVASGANFFQGSTILFSNWPAIEVGVGLIACNLPSLSFRAVNAIPNAVVRGFNISLTSFRNILSHRSGVSSRSGASDRNASHDQTNASRSEHGQSGYRGADLDVEDQKSLGDSSFGRSESASRQVEHIGMKGEKREPEIWRADE